jgi:phosphatidylinositol 3,5-bisphosphate 5-phosphatase
MEEEKEFKLKSKINRLRYYNLYKTDQVFYLIGSDKSKTKFNLLQMDRRESEELIIKTDPNTYSYEEINIILKNTHKHTKGGLTFVTKAYGLMGFIKVKYQI